MIAKPEHAIKLFEALRDERTKVKALTAEVSDWDNRAIINRAVRVYDGRRYGNNDFGYSRGWNDFFKELRYNRADGKLGIDLRARRKNKTGTIIDQLKPEEEPHAMKVLAAMLESNGIDLAAVVNEVNAEKVKGTAV